jgi:4-hydroxybenzoate polyprenyltransferase
MSVLGARVGDGVGDRIGRRGPLALRLWRYQAERFPLGRHGPLILVFSGAAVGYAAVLTGQVPRPGAVLAATGVVLLQFLLMRIADEFKDADDDRRWRPQRPVPRGLVSLRELAGLGAVAACLQLAMVLSAAPAALPLLAAVWGWFLLMTAEFFRPRWLRRRLGIYALSHLLIVPLLALLAMAQQGPLPPLAALPPFLLCTYACSLCLELARKTRPAAAEQPGVDTYSAHWGLRTALAIWLLALLMSALAAWAAAAAIQQPGPLLLLGLLLLLSLARVAPWLAGTGSPSAGQAEPLGGLTALWILAVYAGLGWWPWLALGWGR